MGNFASLMALSLGLNLSPLTRLSELWEEAYRDVKCVAMMFKVNTYLPLVGNCKAYRNALAKHMGSLVQQQHQGCWSSVPTTSSQAAIQPSSQPDPTRGPEGDDPAYPLIPFLAVHMKDLTFLHDGNPHFTPRGLINVDKMMRWGRIIREIQLLQRQPCTIEVDEAIHNFLRNINFLSEETLWSISSSIKS